MPSIWQTKKARHVTGVLINDYFTRNLSASNRISQQSLDSAKRMLDTCANLRIMRQHLGRRRHDHAPAPPRIAR